MTEDAKKLMMSYTWPGNIRELKNAVEYSAMMAQDGIIDTRCLPLSITIGTPDEGDRNADILNNEGLTAAGNAGSRSVSYNENSGTYERETLAELVSTFEKHEINRIIRVYGNTTEGKRKAAKELGISLSSLYAKLGK